MEGKRYGIQTIAQLFMLCIFSLFITVNISYAQDSEEEYIYETEVVNNSSSTLIVPDDISWTQRFILAEMKELRTDLEKTRRELNIELNNRELASVDRALSYSGNTVNFLWLVITMAMAGFGLVGWKTMQDVKENLKENFGKQAAKSLKTQELHLEEFMTTFKEDQLLQSTQLLKNQEKIKCKQEAAYLWSQYNREEDMVIRLEILESIEALDLEENELFISVERSGVYITIGLWDKALENAEKGLELSSENISLLFSKAQSLVMLENIDDALMVINNIIVIKPTAIEELLENPLFENLHKEINEIFSEHGTLQST